MTAFSLQGEPRTAWISTFGIHATNGSSSWKLTEDMPLSGKCALRYDSAMNAGLGNQTPEERRQRFEADKFELELQELRRPWFFKASYLAILAPSIVGLVAIFAAWRMWNGRH